jgi:hypothetical protein
LFRHVFEEALVFICVPAPHLAAEHVADNVQHAVTPLSLPRAAKALVESWYLPLGQVTPVVPHVGLQHVPFTHELGVVGHFVEAALVSFMKSPTQVVASAQLATAVQHAVTPLSAPRSLPAFVESWYLPCAQVTPVAPHFELSA